MFPENVFVGRVLWERIVLSLFVTVIIAGSVCLIRRARVMMAFMERIARRVCVKITAARMERAIKGSAYAKQAGGLMIVR